MKEITLEEMLEGYEGDSKVALHILADDPETTGLVLFKNTTLASSNFGETTVMCVGPERTYKTVEECEFSYLNDLPSERQYAVAYWRKETNQ